MKFYVHGVLFPLLHFSIAMYLTCAHTHTHICRSSSTLDLIVNNFTIGKYDFEHPVHQAEEEGEEDCEVPGELARIL